MRSKLNRWTSATASVLALMLSQWACAQLAPSAQAARPLQVGNRAPDFTARRADGSRYEFSAAHLGQPYVLIFYRGGWCPYCNLQLADLHLVEPRLRKAGFGVIFLSTDRPALLYSSLKESDIDYTLLSDPELQAAQAFHIAFHLDDQQYADQLKWGVDLEQTTGTKAHALPVPSVFIVDASGIIRFVYSNPDFRVRLKAQELWRAALPFAPRPRVD
ncbi:MAG TPA: peroxiredoxin-like family protein [Steroidobacteraceae bacterium]|nr:peroxiredoxin-like family protein [Steroidobacteraceae bacterium]